MEIRDFYLIMALVYIAGYVIRNEKDFDNTRFYALELCKYTESINCIGLNTLFIHNGSRCKI